MTTKLYYHKTDGGAEYLCTSPVEGTDEGDLYTALIRLDGEPELVRPIASLESLEAIQTQLKAAWGRAHYEEIRIAMHIARAIIEEARGN